jgi:hypothetical protein
MPYHPTRGIRNVLPSDKVTSFVPITPPADELMEELRSAVANLGLRCTVGG